MGISEAGRTLATPRGSRLEQMSRNTSQAKVELIVSSIFVALFALSTSIVAVAGVIRPNRNDVWQLAWLLTPALAAAFGWVTLWYLPRARRTPTALLVIVGMLATGFSTYVYWIEKHSPIRHESILVASAMFGVASLGFLLVVTVRRGAEVTRSWKESWPILTAVAAVAVFWFNGYYIPSRERPQIDVLTSLAQTDRSGASVVVSGRVQIKNSGDAGVQVPNDYYTFEAVRRKRSGEPCDESGPRDTLRRDSLLSNEVRLQSNRTWQRDFSFEVRADRYCAIVLSVTLITATEYTELTEPVETLCDNVSLRRVEYRSALDQFLNDHARVYVANQRASSRCKFFAPYPPEPFQDVRYPIELTRGQVTNLERLKDAIPTLRVAGEAELVLLESE